MNKKWNIEFIAVYLITILFIGYVFHIINNKIDTKIKNIEQSIPQYTCAICGKMVSYNDSYNLDTYYKIDIYVCKQHCNNIKYAIYYGNKKLEIITEDTEIKSKIYDIK